MELFTEIYNCYYQIVNEICAAAQINPVTEKDMLAVATRFGFEESGYMIVPRLINDWQLLDKTPEGYLSKIDNLDDIPLTILQKRWLKAVLTEKSIKLFLDKTTLQILNTYLEDIEPLFEPDVFYYYDRFLDGDDYDSPKYIAHFRTLLTAIRKKQYVTIRFASRKDNQICHTYLPCRLEYSSKNDKFRLLAIYERSSGKKTIEIINLSRMESVTVTDRICEETINLKEALQASYYKEPVKLLITTRRNSLERTMLHFANYEKQTMKIDDEHYECLIYYNSMMETELLIEILSFGPTIQVLGPDDFLAKIKERIYRQQQILLDRPHI